MRISEISEIDKLFLAVKGVRYQFEADYVNITDVYPLIGKSTNRKNILLDDIDLVRSNIELLLRQNFPNNDPDIVAARAIYDKLLVLRNKL